jgi:hypothetical protein
MVQYHIQIQLTVIRVECIQEHKTRCTTCDQLFMFIDRLAAMLPENFQTIIEESQNKLYYFLARKVYLSSQLKAKLLELDYDSAILVCDYKMRNLPKSARETKEQFFGK